jgi:hypothetical protein
MVFRIVKADGAGLMESPKVGIIILALVAAAALIGGLAGWQFRLHAAFPETIAANPPGNAK